MKENMKMSSGPDQIRHFVKEGVSIPVAARRCEYLILHHTCLLPQPNRPLPWAKTLKPRVPNHLIPTAHSLM
ncbi:hypothetical protein BD408DRAFT_426422 [Parasitella parasitica]|nr:hypothetical protein BD408DRAFT_426422 [Parasitella parasitica]